MMRMQVVISTVYEGISIKGQIEYDSLSNHSSTFRSARIERYFTCHFCTFSSSYEPKIGVVLTSLRNCQLPAARASRLGLRTKNYRVIYALVNDCVLFSRLKVTSPLAVSLQAS